MKTVLTIAGFDPSSGAGITADLMVFAAHGLFGTSCITALTVQNTRGVFATHPVASDTISSTLDRLYEDLPPAGIKIGMLGTAEAVSSVSAFLTHIRPQTSTVVVLDPVLKSSSGKDLLDEDGLRLLRHELLPQVDWMTPNVDEMWALIGQKTPPKGDLSSAARHLQTLSNKLTIVVTGGHLDPPHDLLLEPYSNEQLVTGERIHTSSTHGTGCAFSSALLCELVLEQTPLAAVRAAKMYVAQAMRSATPIGSGHGPLNHLWPLKPSPKSQSLRS